MRVRLFTAEGFDDVSEACPMRGRQPPNDFPEKVWPFVEEVLKRLTFPRAPFVRIGPTRLPRPPRGEIERAGFSPGCEDSKPRVITLRRTLSPAGDAHEESDFPWRRPRQSAHSNAILNAVKQCRPIRKRWVASPPVGAIGWCCEATKDGRTSTMGSLSDYDLCSPCRLKDGRASGNACTTGSDAPNTVSTR
jgi:hypothetical protein